MNIISNHRNEKTPLKLGALGMVCGIIGILLWYILPWIPEALSGMETYGSEIVSVLCVSFLQIIFGLSTVILGRGSASLAKSRHPINKKELFFARFVYILGYMLCIYLGFAIILWTLWLFGFL